MNDARECATSALDIDVPRLSMASHIMVIDHLPTSQKSRDPFEIRWYDSEACSMLSAGMDDRVRGSRICNLPDSSKTLETQSLPTPPMSSSPSVSSALSQPYFRVTDQAHAAVLGNSQPTIRPQALCKSPKVAFLAHPSGRRFL